jgi:hypothetical protein
MLQPSHLSRFHQHNNACWTVQIRRFNLNRQNFVKIKPFRTTLLQKLKRRNLATGVNFLQSHYKCNKYTYLVSSSGIVWL